MVCRKVLDILIYLAKSFPDDFIVALNVYATPSGKKHHEVAGFFDVLLAHDSIHGNKKVKGLSKHFDGESCLLGLVVHD